MWSQEFEFITEGNSLIWHLFDNYQGVQIRDTILNLTDSKLDIFGVDFCLELSNVVPLLVASLWSSW